MGVQSRKNRRAHRRAVPLGLAGVQSRKNRRAHRRALAMGRTRGEDVQAPGAFGAAPDWYAQMQGPPDWYRQMSGTTLGDDTLDAMAADAKWKADLLASQRELISAQRHWAEGDRMQKWIAIGATLAIPLSAAIWRALGVGRRKKPR